MMGTEHHESEAAEADPVALRIADEERRRTGEFLRDYLARHRMENLPAEVQSDETRADPAG
jgi:hypothetical protein